MSEKNFRPITDVEIVEQMTENDTILIEQNGMLKRTKGVVGGGNKEYLVDVFFDPDSGDRSAEWVTPLTYNELETFVNNGEFIDVTLRMYEGAKSSKPTVGFIGKMTSFGYWNDWDDVGRVIVCGFTETNVVCYPDGTIEST